LQFFVDGLQGFGQAQWGKLHDQAQMRAIKCANIMLTAQSIAPV